MEEILLFDEVGLILGNSFKRGALGPIRNRKTVEKVIQNPKKGLIKTENSMQNFYNRYIFTSQLLRP